MDVQTQTVVIRILIVLLCAWITAEAFRIKRAIGVSRFTRFSYKMFIIFAGFTILRLLATILDAYFSFNVGWFSTIVNALFYFYIGNLFRHQRKLIEASEFDSTGRRRISTIVIQGFEELNAIQERLKVHELHR